MGDYFPTTIQRNLEILVTFLRVNKVRKKCYWTYTELI